VGKAAIGSSVYVIAKARPALYRAPGLSARLGQNGRQLLAIDPDHITRCSSAHQLLVCGEVTHRSIGALASASGDSIEHAAGRWKQPTSVTRNELLA